MFRPLRIGLIAEGETELGASIPYIKPEEGGKVINRDKEGALHTLIRRELNNSGLEDCEFVQRHPTSKESGTYKLRVGHSILELKYLAQIIIAWKPQEVDMIVIVADADDVLSKRQNNLERALNTIRENHLDANELPISDRSLGGLAIRDIEAWLLADYETVSRILKEKIEQVEDLENFMNCKNILEAAIAKSDYLSKGKTNQRPLIIRWKLAFEIDLSILKSSCQEGYAKFTNNLTTVAKRIDKAESETS